MEDKGKGKTSSSEYKKGLWTVEEDKILTDYIRIHGKGKWNRIAKMAGLKRCGKSCRLRWLNYLCPNVKRGDFSQEEDDLIIRLHNLLGNRWSLIAGRVPGRTDNQVKNHWNTRLSKKLGVFVKKGIKSKVKTTSNTSQYTILSKEILQANLSTPSPNFAHSPDGSDCIINGSDVAAQQEGDSDQSNSDMVCLSCEQEELTRSDDGDYQNCNWFWFSDDNLNFQLSLDFVW